MSRADVDPEVEWPGWSDVGVDWLVRNGTDRTIEHDRHGYWHLVDQTDDDD